MPLPSPDPVVLPQTAQKVYGEDWLVSVVIEAPRPQDKVTAVVRVRPARKDPDVPGGLELLNHPADGYDAVVRVEDVFAHTAGRPTARAVLSAIYAYVADVRQNPPTEEERGVVSLTVNRVGEDPKVYPPPREEQNVPEASPQPAAAGGGDGNPDQTPRGQRQAGRRPKPRKAGR
jgi:hypothetical protein